MNLEIPLCLLFGDSFAPLFYIAFGRVSTDRSQVNVSIANPVGFVCGYFPSQSPHPSFNSNATVVHLINPCFVGVFSPVLLTVPDRMTSKEFPVVVELFNVQALILKKLK